MIMKIHHQSGFSLSELMISMVLGLIVMGAALTIFTLVFQTNADSLRRQHLNQDMRAVMAIVTHDIQRAAHWGRADVTAFPQADVTLSQTTVGTATLTDANSSNIFAVTGNDLAGLTLVGGNGQATVTSVDDDNTLTINITDDFDGTSMGAGKWGFLNPFQLVFPTTSTTASCILFTYDLDRNNIVATNERFGYRLNNNAVQMFQSGTHACDNGVWEDLTDTSTNVTAFAITLTSDAADTDGAGPGTSQVINRRVDVNMTANLASDATITRTINTEIKVFNDLFVP